MTHIDILIFIAGFLVGCKTWQAITKWRKKKGLPYE